jgi:hypothetical protein
MIEATTNPTLRHVANAAHIQRSQVAWRMIGALGAWPARILAWNEKRAAPQDGPSMTAGCAA